MTQPKSTLLGEYWTQKAHNNSDNRGKQLRRDGFTLAEERYGAPYIYINGLTYVLLIIAHFSRLTFIFPFKLRINRF